MCLWMTYCQLSGKILHTSSCYELSTVTLVYIDIRQHICHWFYSCHLDMIYVSLLTQNHLVIHWIVLFCKKSAENSFVQHDKVIMLSFHIWFETRKKNSTNKLENAKKYGKYTYLFFFFLLVQEFLWRTHGLLLCLV